MKMNFVHPSQIRAAKAAKVRAEKQRKEQSDRIVNALTNVKGKPGPQGERGPRGLQGPQGERGERGPKGGAGADGGNGWSPVIAVVADRDRRVLKLVRWIGGEGIEPEGAGQYIGPNGLTNQIREAVNVRGERGEKGDRGTRGSDGIGSRGPQGPKGDPGEGGSGGGGSGDNGWSPVLAVENDGVRRVLRVVGWTGGEGTEPATGDYIGAAGLVSDITDAVDVRGEQGPQGEPGNDGASGADGAPGADGADGEQGPQGEPGANGADGADGDNGWSPVLAVVSDGARRVLQVSDWTGGEGTKPAAGQYVGVDGLKAGIADGVDIRGPQGDPGADGADGATGATGAAGADGQGVPTGGTTGQVLAKINSTDYNTQWITPSAGGSAKGFHAHKNGSDQGYTSTASKVTFTTESFDQGGYYDAVNSRYTPPAGLVELSCTVAMLGASSTNEGINIILYKNGSSFKEVSYRETVQSTTNNSGGVLNVLDVANGTDYYEIYIRSHSTNGTVKGAGNVSYFQGIAYG